jgi:PAS domain S-box-containing protein
MSFMSNSGFLAAAFINCSAAFVLLVVYVLLAPSCPARFFRYWIGGWTLYVFTAALRISRLWNGGTEIVPLRTAVSLLTALVFFAAVLEVCGRGQRVKYLWPLAAIGIPTAYVASKASLHAALQMDAIGESSLLIASGLLLWRCRRQHRGFGWEMLAGSLLLWGLHGLDRPDWAGQALAVFRSSAQGLFGIMSGVAMAVLVLEAGRTRTEELNEKLKRLALITAGATQSHGIDEMLAGALRNVTAALNASHGLVFLQRGEADSNSLFLRASQGFSARFTSQYSQVSTSEEWVQNAMSASPRTVLRNESSGGKTPPWMEKEKLTAAVFVAIPGKDKPLGGLCVGSSGPREFENDETDFLVNVANLLGLAVQNVALLEAAATSQRQLLDTLDSMDDLIFVHSQEGRVLRANRSLAWHLGLEPDLIQGQSLRELLKQGEIRWNTCPYCENAAGKPEQVDPSFGGHFLVTNSDFHDSEGNRLGTVHALKDFTERREAENKFRVLFEKVQEGIFISTPQGRFLDFNDAFMRMLGYEKREDLLKVDIPSELYVDAEERARLTRLLHEYGEVTDFEFHFRRPDGDIRIAHESSFVTRDPQGAIVAYQGFVLDVTERKQAEMEIRRRNRELLALNAIAELLSQSPKLEDALSHALAKIGELFSADVASVYFLDENTRCLKRAANFGHRSEYARKMGAVEISSALLQQVRRSHFRRSSASCKGKREFWWRKWWSSGPRIELLARW